MFNGTYDTEDNGSGYADDFIPGKKGSYRALSNNVVKDEDISKAFQEETDTNESGLGEGDDDTWDDPQG